MGLLGPEVPGIITSVCNIRQAGGKTRLIQLVVPAYGGNQAVTFGGKRVTASSFGSVTIESR